MKQIYVATSVADAELACSQLRNAGFDAVVQGDVVAIPSGPFPSVWVPDDEAAAAAEAWNRLASQDAGED